MATHARIATTKDGLGNPIKIVAEILDRHDPVSMADHEVHDVTKVSGIAIGMRVNADGTYSHFTAKLTAGDLAAYARAQQSRIMAGGTSVSLGPLTIRVDTDIAGLVLLHSAYSVALANADAAFSWVQPNSAPVTLTSVQMMTAFNAIAAFVQATFNTLAGILGSISAGTVTTIAQIDAAFATTN